MTISKVTALVSTGIVCFLAAPVASAQPQTQTQAIRDIDFGNRRYSGPKDYNVTFELRDGEQANVQGKEDGVVLSAVRYHDLTGDGAEEAILTMAIQTGGSAIPQIVFVYTIKRGRPFPLWSFISGDRADGGIRDIVPKNGELTLEFGGEVTFENARFKSRSIGDAACCPSRISKFVLRWNGRRFAQVGPTQITKVD